jgi:hypothetical protein
VNAWALPGGSSGRLQRFGPGLAGFALFGALLALGGWLMWRPLDRGHGPDYQRAPGSAKDLAGAAIMSRAGIPSHPAPDLPSGAPAAPFAISLGRAATPAGAILRLRLLGAAVPAGAFAPMPGTAGADYQIVAGAFQTSNDAQAMLRELRAHGQLSETSGTVVRVPLAFLIERDVAAGAAAARVAALTDRGLSVYALRQTNGRAWLYAGAFASASDTTPLATALRAAGVHATLAYRTGRPF